MSAGASSSDPAPALDELLAAASLEVSQAQEEYDNILLEKTRIEGEIKMRVQASLLRNRKAKEALAEIKAKIKKEENQAKAKAKEEEKNNKHKKRIVLTETLDLEAKPAAKRRRPRRLSSSEDLEEEVASSSDLSSPLRLLKVGSGNTFWCFPVKTVSCCEKSEVPSGDGREKK